MLLGSFTSKSIHCSRCDATKDSTVIPVTDHTYGEWEIYEHIRWIENPQEVDVNRIVGTSDMKKIKDLKGNPLLVFANSWSVNMVLERNEGLKLSEFGRN